MLALMLDDTTLNLLSTQEPFELSKRSSLQPDMEAKQLPLSPFCFWKVSKCNFSQFGHESQNNKPQIKEITTYIATPSMFSWFLLGELSIKSQQAELAIYHFSPERDTKTRKLPILLFPTAKPKSWREFRILVSLSTPPSQNKFSNNTNGISKSQFNTFPKVDRFQTVLEYFTELWKSF